MQDFKGCNVNIHGKDGNKLFSARIKHHDKIQNHIMLSSELSFMFDELIAGEQYNVVILSPPKPQAFNGIVRKKGLSSNEIAFTLFNGRPTCNRREERHNINLPADIEWLQSGNRRLINTKTKAKIVNISKHGARLQYKQNVSSIDVNDRIKIQIHGGGSTDTTIVAEIRNHTEIENPSDHSEIGCRFIEVGED